ncbi:MAG: hypothetical protein AYK22_00510 [Thermoplasmatales archaeon SG8-52-3]|nr:MAG: hypothetical protein AYK22_00510 [Thermoplasmatales archaeon SG8-52-3]
MKKKYSAITTILLFFILLISFNNINTSAEQEISSKLNELSPLNFTDNLPYEGFLRIYIVEPDSRWNMYNGRPYHYGFIDFAYEGALSIDYLDSYQDSITWIGDVTEDNVFVIAVIFNPTANIGYSFPPSSKPFDAYYVDATASAHPGENGYNIRDENFTHTVFIEEGTGTWCKNCPSAADSLYNLSKSSTIPFYYAAMVEDMNSAAQKRLEEDYNIFGYPTLYYDGGKEVLLGGGNSDEYIESLIESCAESDVHELDLNLTVSWQGDGELKIDYKIINLEEIIPPQFYIQKIYGGIKKVNVFVENTGDNNSYNVDWEISITGGFLGRVNSISNGTIDEFPSGEAKLIRSKGQLFQPFGFGNIEVIVKIGTNIEKFNCFIFGPFIIVNI